MARARFVVALVAVVVVWPLLHRAIVAAYDVNPWKLGGFAMYTTATPPVLTVAFEPRGEGGVPIDRRELPAYVQQTLLAFEKRRHVLGNLARPDDFASQVLQARPDLPTLVILVQRIVLDPSTGRMQARTMHYKYDRTGFVAEKSVPPTPAGTGARGNQRPKFGGVVLQSYPAAAFS